MGINAKNSVGLEEQYLKNTKKYLGEVNAEAEALRTDWKRKKRELDECEEEIEKLQRYAEKAVLANNDEDARQYLTRKFILMEKFTKLQQEYEIIAAQLDKIDKQREELINDIETLATRT